MGITKNMAGVYEGCEIRLYHDYTATYLFICFRETVNS